MQLELHRHLRELATAGHTVFFSSHSLAEVEQLCDRVAIVRDGEIVADETLEDLRRRAGHQVKIRWSQAPGCEAPAFLHLEERGETEWSGMLEGGVPDLLRWLHGRPVQDLAIGRPDLESVFRRYYEREGPP